MLARIAGLVTCGSTARDRPWWGVRGPRAWGEGMRAEDARHGASSGHRGWSEVSVIAWVLLPGWIRIFSTSLR